MLNQAKITPKKYLKLPNIVLRQDAKLQDNIGEVRDFEHESDQTQVSA